MNLSIAHLASLYQRDELTPRRLVEALCQRAESIHNPYIWIHRLSPEELEPYLARLDGVDPNSLPLYGIPFAIKDNIDLAGVPTTAACPAYAFTPEVSATVVEHLIQAGAIPLGKTNLDQFATGLVGLRSPYGVPRNPLAPDRVPGGSSSGSAVALSESLASFSLGTDTAGSGRVPAMFNRLWGLKPSRDHALRAQPAPACRTLDCVSIFAHNAEDAQRVLGVAEGYDSADAYSLPTRDMALPSSNRLGVPKPEQLMFFGDANYRPAWEAALERLRVDGWELIEVDFEPFLQTARLLYEGPWVSERTTALRDFLESNADDFYPTTRSIIAGGMEHSACQTFAAAYKLAELRRQSESAWDGIAAIVTPTAGGFPTLAELKADPIGPNSQLGYYTNFMNLLDLCAVATPAGETGTGLPFGLTWIAPRDTDRALIDLAAKGPVGGAEVSFPPPADGHSLEATKASQNKSLPILLFGAHMRGLPLNAQVLELGGEFIAEVRTAPKYKMVYLPEPAPHRPGIVRIAQQGASLAAEEWSFPESALGEFLSTLRQPLGLGQIELEAGRQVHGFLCEAVAAEVARDISASGGWRPFLQSC
jgi:allophanate hydrolase